MDGYYSMALGDKDINEGPIACVLPNLLASFYFIHEEEYEKRCLSVIMRMFNQREELKENLLKL